MNKTEDLTKLILEFRDARDWKQFHNPKDVALSLVLEATEVLEHFQWKSEEEINTSETYINLNNILTIMSSRRSMIKNENTSIFL